MKIAVLFIFLLIIVGCELFTTREPEKPDTGETGYIPPTEPEILILNFENSIKRLNADNYIKCFFDEIGNHPLKYKFYPTASALAMYPSMFDDWSVESERRLINRIASQFGSESLQLVFPNRKPILETPDSAIFAADYVLTLPQKSQNQITDFRGRIQLTLISKPNGLWYISRWFDYPIEQVDSENNTWSILKAIYFN
jgi:hypothetical protein